MNMHRLNPFWDTKTALTLYIMLIGEVINVAVGENTLNGMRGITMPSFNRLGQPINTTIVALAEEQSILPNLNVTESTVPSICIDGVKLSKSFENNDITENNYEDEDELVQIIEGDAIISILTRDPVTALFIVDRVNKARLIGGDFELGMRAIFIKDISHTEHLLIQEVQYLQQCTEHPIGVFLDFDLYTHVKELIDDLEYYIWPIPSTRSLLFPKVVHLIYQMPWGEKSASVEIIGENLNIYNDFMDAAKDAQLCLMHFRSPDNIYILLGNKIMKNFQENGTIFAIPTTRINRSLIKGLPSQAYILMESEVALQIIDENSTLITLHETLLGKNVLTSELLSMSGPLLHLVHWLNNSLMTNCEQSQGLIHYETCYNYLKFIQDWNSAMYEFKPDEILDKLKIRKMSHLMQFQMLQKVPHTSFEPLSKKNDIIYEWREIASQNFITNITTYFHYNIANETSHKMKSKFGQIFNCQYSDGTNRKFPFYFEGESVMFWRLKPEPWIAAGLTASILGIIISIAILVFIVIRISVGDVFEGNPIGSIALLISLVLLFLTFIPFSLEYGSDHLNSQITYEDASTMNTLCAIRVFLITISYCLVFSLLLCRALMLASIGSEGGFLSHVNGYIQAVICIFSSLVQIGLSTQLLIVMHVAEDQISCNRIFHGNLFWALMSYDVCLLVFLVILIPFIYRSQRNYREGLLIVIGGILCFLIWCTWIPMCFFGDEWRDAAIPGGMQATGWAILIGILIPRSFLIVRGIERSDIAQALPSLTSIAFAQNNQYPSEQSVYECVNPAMRYSTSREDGMTEARSVDRVSQPTSPSEMPTLPLRGTVNARRNMFQNMRNNNSSMARRASYASSQSSMPPSPNKITRF